MNASELRTLCTALGFTAVVSKDGGKGDAARAKAMAALIEEFCRSSGESASDNFMQNNEPLQNNAWEQGDAAGLWSCSERDGCMVIEAEDKSGAKSVIAELRAKPGADQAAVAASIVAALNNSARKDALIAELTACLEMCLASDSLTWDAEHDSDVVLKRARRAANKA